MNHLNRKRIDVSVDAHAQLEMEARRQGIAVRDLIDRLVLQLTGQADQANASPARQAEASGKAAIASWAAQLRALTERVDGLIERVAEDVPKALDAGFDAIKDTIRKTGGTEHLRKLIDSYEASHKANFDGLKAGQTTLKDEQAKAINASETAIVGKIAASNIALEALADMQISRRRVAAAFSAGSVFGFIALTLLLADTPLTRWYAIRLTGNTQAANAAFALAGDGRTAGALMAKTKGLLANPKFRADYTRCVIHAGEVKLPFPCRLTVPPIEMVKR